MTHLYNSAGLKKQRKDLRNNATLHEKKLWYELKNKKLGFKFRRQTSIGYYIVDFYCPRMNLVIEVDGKIHLEKDRLEYDQTRTLYFKKLGLREIRFTNDEIDSDIKKVINKIRICLNAIQF